MKQRIRLSTFETNSSSLHTLIIVDKDLFDRFKSQEVYFDPRSQQFKDMNEITKMDEFREEYPDYKNRDKSVQDYMIDQFIKNNFNCDYALGWTCGALDLEYKTVYDKEGNEQMALSIYVGEC